MSTVMITSTGEFCAFGGDALLQTLVEEQHLGLDAGLGREGVEHRLDQIGLAVGVDVDHAVRSCRARDERRKRKGGAGQGPGVSCCHCPSLLTGKALRPFDRQDNAERALYLRNDVARQEKVLMNSIV